MLKEVYFKRLRQIAKIPQRAYDSAGYDLFPSHSGEIYPGRQEIVHLGFSAAFDPEYVAIIDDRGSTGISGLHHMAGVIDADFRGEWRLIIRNAGHGLYEFGPDRAIAQVLFHRVEKPVFVEIDELPPSSRGAGMLGSSGY